MADSFHAINSNYELRIKLLFINIIAYACKQRQRHLLLIFLRIKQRRFLGIGQKSAFRHYRGILAVIAQKQFLSAQLYFAVVFGLKYIRKAVLQALGKGFASAVRGGIKHLRTAVYGVCELILMYRDAQRIVVFIEQRQSIIHVGAFLIGKSLDSAVMDRNVGISRYFNLVAV